MVPRRLDLSRLGTVLAMLAVGVGPVGCGDHSRRPDSAPASTTASTATSTARSARGYDVSRVANVRNDFPAGFGVEVRPERILGRSDIGGSTVLALTDAVITPVECRAVVIPPYVDAAAGSRVADVRAIGDRGRVNVVALRSTEPIPAAHEPASCDMEILISGPPGVAGTAEHILAPEIAGVRTTGVKLAHGEARPAGYMFTAVLNDETAVVVMGTAADELDPHQFLSDLLVKATAAVRGAA